MQAILDEINSIAPIKFACSWDNVGILVDRFISNPDQHEFVLFLTNDLTEAVLDEAVSKQADVIITYHPSPFHSTKKFVNGDRISRVIAKAIAANILIYSPHTALDCVKDGTNDWFANIVFSGLNFSSKPITPLENDNETGEGRLITLETPISLDEVKNRVLTTLELPYIRYAAAPSREQVKTAAICVGSGATVFASLKQQPDVCLTGEIDHHTALSIIENGGAVVTCEHSRSERGYLKVLKNRLEKQLMDKTETYKVIVSQVDSDPFNIVVSK